MDKNTTRDSDMDKGWSMPSERNIHILYTNTETRTVKLIGTMTGTKRETLIPHRSNTPIRIVTATRTGIRRRTLTGKRKWTMALTGTRKVRGAKIVSWTKTGTWT